MVNIDRLLGQSSDPHADFLNFYVDTLRSKGLVFHFKDIKRKTSLKELLEVQENEWYHNAENPYFRCFGNYINNYRKYLDKPFLFECFSYELTLNDEIFIKNKDVCWHEFLSKIFIDHDCSISIKGDITKYHWWSKISERSYIENTDELLTKLQNDILASWIHTKDYYLKKRFEILELDLFGTDFHNFNLKSYLKNDLLSLYVLEANEWGRKGIAVEDLPLKSLITNYKSNLDKNYRKIKRGIVVYGK